MQNITTHLVCFFLAKSLALVGVIYLCYIYVIYLCFYFPEDLLFLSRLYFYPPLCVAF